MHFSIGAAKTCCSGRLFAVSVLTRYSAVGAVMAWPAVCFAVFLPTSSVADLPCYSSRSLHYCCWLCSWSFQLLIGAVPVIVAIFDWRYPKLFATSQFANLMHAINSAVFVLWNLFLLKNKASFLLNKKELKPLQCNLNNLYRWQNVRFAFTFRLLISTWHLYHTKLQ